MIAGITGFSGGTLPMVFASPFRAALLLPDFVSTSPD
jgi:hypothetical protein